MTAQGKIWTAFDNCIYKNGIYIGIIPSTDWKVDVPFILEACNAAEIRKRQNDATSKARERREYDERGNGT